MIIVSLMTRWWLGFRQALGTGSAPAQHPHAWAEDCVWSDSRWYWGPQAYEILGPEMPQACVMGEERVMFVFLNKPRFPQVA